MCECMRLCLLMEARLDKKVFKNIEVLIGRSYGICQQFPCVMADLLKLGSCLGIKSTINPASQLVRLPIIRLGVTIGPGKCRRHVIALCAPIL